MSPEQEINELLSNDVAVKAINGSRVYFIQAPQKDMNTYIVFNMVKEPVRTFDGIAYYNNTLITEIYAKKNETVFQLEAAVINAFESFAGTLIQKIYFVESFSEKNEETSVSYKIIKSVLTVKN